MSKPQSSGRQAIYLDFSKIYKRYHQHLDGLTIQKNTNKIWNELKSKYPDDTELKKEIDKQTKIFQLEAKELQASIFLQLFSNKNKKKVKISMLHFIFIFIYYHKFSVEIIYTHLIYTHNILTGRK